MCGIIFFSISTVEAQSFGNKLKNKVLNKLENKANEKIDKSINSAVDKPVDKTEEKVKESVKSDKSKSNSSSSSSTNSGTSQNGGNSGYNEADIAKMMEMMNSEVKVSDFPDQPNVQPSTFIGSFDMIIEDYKSNGSLKETSTIKWYVDKYELVMIPEMKDAEGSKVIMNRKKGIMVVLTGGNTGMIMKMTDIGDLVENSDYVQDDIDDVKVQVFKNVTEMIDGHKCYKVVVTDEDTESTAWVAENFGVRMDQLFGYMGMQSKGESKYEEKFGHIDGFALKVTSLDKESGKKTVMMTKNVNKGAIPSGMTSTDGYKLMQMPDMSNMPFMNQGRE